MTLSLTVMIVVLFRRSKQTSTSRVLHHDNTQDHYKEALTLNKATLGRGTDDYALTALPLHATLDQHRRVGHDGLNDYTYVWDSTPGHCSTIPGGGGRFGAIAVDDCCLATCNNPVQHGTADDVTNTTANQMTSLTICPQNELAAPRKQMEVNYLGKCGTLSHVPTYVCSTLCGDPQPCNGDCVQDGVNRT